MKDPLLKDMWKQVCNNSLIIILCVNYWFAVVFEPFFLFQAGADDETEDNGSECVICMCDMRDTLILPCRHLCLCNSCADSLRYQANNCPICRAPFRALLQIRALQKSANANLAPISASDVRKI